MRSENDCVLASILSERESSSRSSSWIMAVPEAKGTPSAMICIGVCS
mgnify:CR=1 FL=1